MEKSNKNNNLLNIRLNPGLNILTDYDKNEKNAIFRYLLKTKKCDKIKGGSDALSLISRIENSESIMLWIIVGLNHFDDQDLFEILDSLQYSSNKIVIALSKNKVEKLKDKVKGKIISAKKLKLNAKP
jgi:hypothetical protein